MQLKSPQAGKPDAAAQIGFFGKIPARGDFVRSGLPRGFVEPWDDWLRNAMAESRQILGESWVPSWMEAPVWRFRLPAGACGPEPAMGVFMPSVDRAGRYFPLTIACLPSQAASLAWLDIAEAAGIAALEHELEPDALMAMLQDGARPPPDSDGIAGSQCAWWTSGGPRVPETSFATRSLPDGAVFSRMLDSGLAHPHDPLATDAPRS